MIKETTETEANAEVEPLVSSDAPPAKYYDCHWSCNHCGGNNNNVSAVDTLDGHTLMEARTKCRDCGFEDYWAHGFFESGAKMVGKSEKYYFDRNDCGLRKLLV